VYQISGICYMNIENRVAALRLKNTIQNYIYQAARHSVPIRILHKSYLCVFSLSRRYRYSAHGFSGTLFWFFWRLALLLAQAIAEKNRKK